MYRKISKKDSVRAAVVISPDFALDWHVKRKSCKLSFLIPVANPAISMEDEECDEEENGNENGAMAVISTGDILNANPFIELVIEQGNDENED